MADLTPTGGPRAAAVTLAGAGVCFGEHRAVDALDLTLAPRSFTALLGPSGCGKSTTLGMVAGLLDPTEGDVLLDGESVLGQPPERRPVSLVFQKPLLFPHLSIEQNVGFGLRMAKVPTAQIRTQVGEMLERVRLDGLGARRVGELSGGQEQRVSLARALVLRPRLLLLDEPFSQLDADLRVEMRSLVRGLHDESDVTTLFVTHDQDEAVELADEIALMLAGRLAGRGTPEDFYLRPPTLAAARFFGSTNEVHGQVADGGILVIRPESVQLGEPGSSTQPSLAATVTATRFAGTHVVVDAAIADGQSIRAHVPVDRAPASGAAVELVLPPSRCTIFPQESR